MTRVRHLVALLAFGVAFGYVEAAVVFYLRRLLDYHTGYSVVGRHVYLDLGFIAFVTLGAGMFIGSYLSGMVLDSYAIADTSGAAVRHNWYGVWMIPAAMALGVLILFAIFFSYKEEAAKGVRA